MPKRLLTAAVAAGILTLPSAADAATYCVGTPVCAGTMKDSLTEALAASDATVEVDEIVLGYGAFVGNWKNAPGRPVRIKGQKIAGTTIMPANGNAPGLALSGEGSVVRDLAVAFAADRSYQTGLHLSDGASATMIGAHAEQGSFSNVAIELGERASLTTAQLGLANHNSTEGVRVTGDGATISDVTVQARLGVVVRADATIRRAKIDSTNAALTVQAGTATVENAVLDVRDGQDGVRVYKDSPTKAARADISNVTLVGSDGGWQLGVGVGPGAEVSIRDSIVTGVATAFTVDGWLALDHVDRDPKAKTTGLGTITDVAPLLLRPEFVEVGKHQFTIAPSSPLVDAGTDTPLAAGETDMAGKPRITDGDGDCTPQRDIGAYEVAATPTCVAPPAPPAPPTPATPTAEQPAPTAMDRVSPKLTKLKLTRSKLTFRASEQATVTIRVERRRGKRYIKARTITKRARAGANSVKLNLPKGPYRARIQAVDAAGNRATAGVSSSA